MGAFELEFCPLMLETIGRPAAGCTVAVGAGGGGELSLMRRLVTVGAALLGPTAKASLAMTIAAVSFAVGAFKLKFCPLMLEAIRRPAAGCTVAVGAGGGGELPLMRRLMAENAIGLLLQIAALTVAAVALQSGMCSVQRKAGALMAENLRFQQFARDDVELSSGMIGVAGKAFFLELGVITQVLFSSGPKLLVAIETETVRDSAADAVTLEAVAVVPGMQRGQGTGAGQQRKRFRNSRLNFTRQGRQQQDNQQDQSFDHQFYPFFA